MSYFVSPARDTPWQMAPGELADRLRAAWPDAVVHPVADPAGNHSLEWTLTTEGRRVDGSLDVTGQAVHLEGDVDACARLARRQRHQVP